MTLDNVTKAPEAPEIIISPTALDAVELDIPPAYLDEYIGEDLANSIAEYRKIEQYQRAARHTEDHARAEEFRKTLNLLRSSIAAMQEKYPGAKPISREIAEVRVQKLRRERRAALAREE